jgi:putative modified peptide
MYDNIDPLIDRWISDEAFRTALQRDPQAALRDAGISLAPDEQEALKAVDWSHSDDELTARVSKCVGG